MQPTFKVELAKCLGFFVSLGSFVFCLSATSTEWFIEKKRIYGEIDESKIVICFQEFLLSNNSIVPIYGQETLKNACLGI